MSIQLESSTIPLWIGDLFMHYWENPLVDDYDNPEWQNQGFFFWFADEDFEKKSLPPNFEKMDKRFFRIIDSVKIFQGTAAPWFGMPGGGTKMGVPFYQIKELIRKENIAVFSSNYTLYGDLSRRLNWSNS